MNKTYEDLVAAGRATLEEIHDTSDVPKELEEVTEIATAASYATFLTFALKLDLDPKVFLQDIGVPSSKIAEYEAAGGSWTDDDD